jgi:NAD(P)-dependent dehydrogenase (short-subunit alcohol dehydrogenase family)
MTVSKQKVALVSGAGSITEGVGNGRAAAILLARAGYAVGVTDISKDAAELTSQMIAAEGNTAIAIESDATSRTDAESAVDQVVREYGRLDALVNNVGIIGAMGNAVTVDPDDFEQVLRVNVLSGLLMSKYAIPHMIANGGGVIVNIASGAGILAGHPSIGYPTSKAAVVMMTKAMAFHHGPDGVRVNCVAPGFVYTPRVTLRAQSAEAAAEAREQRRLAAPIQIEGTAWDVGEAVKYLVSEEARFVTGVVLPVDGGYTIGRP